MKLNKKNLNKIIKAALKEDSAASDITSLNIDFSSRIVKASIMSKEPGIACGLEIAAEVFKKVSARTDPAPVIKDGDKLYPGCRAIEIEGAPEDIFAAERVALNFLSHLSGIATLAASFAEMSGGTAVYDTRKTIPLLRELEKYAVITGGGKNHRFSLADQVLIKENHIAASGKDITTLLMEVRERTAPDIKIEIEIENLSQFEQALQGPADIIMLDNFTPEEVRLAVKAAGEKKPGVQIEVSGGINLSNVHLYAQDGVDRISVGALTSAAPPVDFTLLIDE